MLHDLRRKIVFWEGAWFDHTRRVRTSGFSSVKNLDVKGSSVEAFDYLPARPANVRSVLRNLPLTDASAYSFVDLGSGKGRVLFIAAETCTFQKIIGVEFARELHCQAELNLRTFRRKATCAQIELVHDNAADYSFPGGNLVVHLFNPFGPVTLEKVVSNLLPVGSKSDRHIVICLTFPEHAAVMNKFSVFRPLHLNRRFHIYQTE